MMDRQTQKILRNSYYVGIFLLILYVLPYGRMLDPILNFNLGGFKIIEGIAVLVALGALFAYKRRIL